MEICQAGMGRSQGAIREIHALMPFCYIVLVGSLMRVGVPRLFLFMLVFMIIVNGPEFPSMGMCRFHVGALMAFIGMGVEKKERREGEKDISGQQEAEKASAFRSLIQPMEG